MSKPQTISAPSLEAAGNWMWDVRADRMYVDERAARLFGVEYVKAKQGLPCAAFSQAIHPDDRQRVHELATAPLLNGGAFRSYHRLLRPDGTVRWVIAVGQAFAGGEAPVSFYGGILVDVTAEANLGERDKIASLLSHAYEQARGSGMRLPEYLIGMALLDIAGDPSARSKM